MRILLAATLAAVLAPIACSESRDPVAARGRAVYFSNCIACHARDPARDGALGPALAGSSRVLLEARLLRGEYPPGYTPKRTTGAMPLFPSLEPELDALAAFLAASGG